MKLNSLVHYAKYFAIYIWRFGIYFAIFVSSKQYSYTKHKLINRLEIGKK